MPFEALGALVADGRRELPEAAWRLTRPLRDLVCGAAHGVPLLVLVRVPNVHRWPVLEHLFGHVHRGEVLQRGSREHPVAQVTVGGGGHDDLLLVYLVAEVGAEPTAGSYPRSLWASHRTAPRLATVGGSWPPPV